MKKLLRLCLIPVVCHTAIAADLLTTPAKSGDPSSYSTQVDFLAATRKGEIPALLKDQDPRNYILVGKNVISILRDELHVPADRANTQQVQMSCGLLLSNITQYELGGRKDTRAADSVQSNLKTLQGRVDPKFFEAFNSFAKEYAKAVTQSVLNQQESDAMRQIADAEKQRQTALDEERAAQESKQRIAAAEAKSKSKLAEEEERVAAAKTAVAEQEKARQDKLNEVLASPAYKLWKVSVQVEEGFKLIREGKQALAHDDSVTSESQVSDLAERRAAGEKVAAGKKLVESAFAKYQELGGTAATPEEVHAGTDPAQEYR